MTHSQIHCSGFKMKLAIRLVLLSLMLVGCNQLNERCPVPRYGPSRRFSEEVTKIPVELPGHTLHGIGSRFYIDDLSPSTGHLGGRLLLSNTNNNPRPFGIFLGFRHHVWIYDIDGRRLSEGAGEAIREDLLVPANGELVRRFNVDLGERAKLVPGIYKIGFTYDLRLNGRIPVGSEPLVPWSDWGIVMIVPRQTTQQ